MTSLSDEQWMEKAIVLSEKGRYTTRPNPLVGCLLVKNNKCIGWGWHAFAGQAHAEIRALKQAGADAAGSTCYVTLMPCGHYGRTPPCVDALIDAGVTRVVIGADDPNSKAQAGYTRLKQQGIETVVGLLSNKVRQLNAGFFSHYERKRPYVSAKVAMSMDGKVALSNGTSKWITHCESREDGHRLRAKAHAVMTGIGTILADDPTYNVRVPIAGYFEPALVILDAYAKLPMSAKVLSVHRIVYWVVGMDTSLPEAIHHSIRVMRIPMALNGTLDILKVMDYLYDVEIQAVLVESGPTLLGHMLERKLIDELIMYVSPKILGDAAISFSKMSVLSHLSDGIEYEWIESELLGTDLKLTARIRLEKKNVYRTGDRTRSDSEHLL